MKRLFALFPNYLTAERALDKLCEHNVSRRRLGVLLQQNLLSQHLLHLKNEAHPHQAPGIIPGAAIGTLTGLLAGIGTVTLPNVGTIVAAGDLRARHSESVPALLHRLGMKEDRVRQYHHALRNGNVILMVRLDGDSENVQELFTEAGGDTITTCSPDQ